MDPKHYTPTAGLGPGKGCLSLTCDRKAKEESAGETWELQADAGMGSPELGMVGLQPSVPPSLGCENNRVRRLGKETEVWEEAKAG